MSLISLRFSKNDTLCGYFCKNDYLNITDGSYRWNMTRKIGERMTASNYGLLGYNIVSGLEDQINKIESCKYKSALARNK